MRDEPNSSGQIQFKDLVQMRIDMGMNPVPLLVILSNSGDFYPKTDAGLVGSKFLESDRDIVIFTSEAGKLNIERNKHLSSRSWDNINIIVLPCVDGEIPHQLYLDHLKKLNIRVVFVNLVP